MTTEATILSRSADILALSAQLGQLLKTEKHILSSAESCTGGGVAQAITDIPGSSAWFDCGFVCYSNTSKNELLDISEADMALHGAVSEEIAAAMALGAIGNSDANVALSTTGIAGPAGASPGKPIGTVCFAWAINHQVSTERKVFDGDRQAIRQQAVQYSLRGLIQRLQQNN